MSKNSDDERGGLNLWAIYVQAVAPQEGRREKVGRRQADVGKRAGVSQSTISRWRDGGAPKDPGTVAAFAKAYEHSVLEAFVAAGMLEEADAGRGLSAESRRFLAELRGLPAPAQSPAKETDEEKARRLATNAAKRVSRAGQPVVSRRRNARAGG